MLLGKPCSIRHRLGLMSHATPAPFRAKPPSPSSHAVDSAKLHQLYLQNRPKDQIPHTPTSPPLMSVSAQNYASSFSTTQTSPPKTLQIASLPPSPSSVPMCSQISQQPTVTSTTSLSTPASSAGGLFTSNHTMREAEDISNNVTTDPRKDGESYVGKGIGLDLMDIDTSDHRRTDHDRQNRGLDQSFGGNTMDLDYKATSSTQEEELSLAALQQDIGTAFHLCKSCKVSLRHCLA